MFLINVIFLSLSLTNFAVSSHSHDELNKKALFSIIAPKIIHPNQRYSVTVFTEKGDEVVVVRLKLECGSALYSAEENEIPPGKKEILGVDVSDLASGTCSLNIKAKLHYAEWDSLKSVYNETKTLHVASKSISILIQLDKPIYKPGEVVKFRVLFLNRQLRPLTGEGAEIKITDPQNNVIRLHKNQSIPKGLFSGEMKLSSEPNLGDWEIMARLKEDEEKIQFSVAQYVLPKFKVEVILPKFIVNTTSKIKAEIKATYTYGKGVQGQVTVKLISPHENWYPYWDDIRFQERRKRFALSLIRSKRVPIAIIRPPPPHFRRPPTTTPSPEKLITMPIDGSVFVDLDVPNNVQVIRNEYSENTFTVEATVTETVTGKQQNGTGKVKMYAYSFKIEEIDRPEFYKPGFPLKLTFKISSQDGTPITDDKKDAFEISHGFSYDDQGSTFRCPVPSTGIVTFTVTTPSNENIMLQPIKVTYKDVEKTFSVPQKMSSSTKTYIQVTVANIEEHIVKVASNKPMKAVNYLAIVQGKVVDSGREDFPNEKTEASLIVNVNKDTSCGPKVTILVYAIFGAKNEIVVDSTSYTVKTTLTNYLNIKLSKEKAEPGDNITLFLETNPNSIIALRGVDQSVLLLKEEKNIDSNRIDEVLKTFNSEIENHKIWGGSPASRTFDDSGILVFTNCFLEEIPEYRNWGPPPMFFRGGGGGARPMMAMAMNDAAGAAPQMMASTTSVVEMSSVSPMVTLVSPTRVRENFPESWIWETIDALNTRLEIPKTVPDTLTSWILTGFSLNLELGIGVSMAPQILESFRPFFISLNLPYSVVKGEIFALQVLLHNYMNEEVIGVVTLDNEKKHLKFLQDKDGDPVKISLEKSFKIPPHQVSSITFVIIPVKIGDIKLNFVAKTTMAGDALSQPLTVKPPGHKQSKNSAVLLDVRSGTPVTLKLTTMFPEKRVEDGDSVIFSVIGDLLGSTISNLDKLIQMPCGCGEQNMLNFVPDIVILDYLKASGTLTPGIKRTAINFLEIGYQRELTYRHFDGSFSAFGQSDSSGSTWLTAFVARSFISAKRYITIDEHIITDALEYLSRLQNENGMFIEKGQVIHSDMQGGANSGIALTAYVLLSFLEASEMMSISFKYNSIVKKAVEYLSKKMVDLEDPYPIILICYAFHVANSDKKDAAFKKVEKLARHEKQHTFWSTGKESIPPTTVDHGNLGAPVPFRIINIVHHEQKPVNVEMTAYALQTYLLRNKVVESVPIAKWLLTQRNSNGGFLSTQDTVVGLTALAKFAMSTKSPDSQLQINLQHSKEDQHFSINKENDMVLQEFFMSPDTKEITVSASGKGIAMAQLSWNYYLEDSTVKPAFSITTQVKKSEDIKGKFVLNICTAYTPGGVSNMAVVEVSLPSGYGFEAEKLPDLLKIPKLVRYEEENDHAKLNIYFTSLNVTKSCFEIEANRLFIVAKLAPASIIVYDYYDTTKKARAFYDPPTFSICDMCASDPSMCGDKVNCVYRNNRLRDRGLL